MAYEKICTLDDVWEGEMKSFVTKNGTEVLVIAHTNEQIVIVQNICPHQEIKLSKKGNLSEDGVLTCTAHLWKFNSSTGKGINPTDCKLSIYPSKVDNNDIFVNINGIVPEKSHS